jgi:hypothetical protein
MQRLAIRRAIAPVGAAVLTSLALIVGAQAALAAKMPAAVGSLAIASTPRPITEHASRVTADSAMLHGVIATHGVKTEWQFEFGRTTAYGRATPVKSIPAGKGTMPVSWMIKHLAPATTYHFRLVAIVATVTGPHRIYGRDEMFTTRRPGRVLLTHTLLHVIGGRVMVPLRCDSTVPCAGHLRIDVRVALKHHFASVLCAAGGFALSAHGIATFRLRARSACLAKLRAAKHHRLIAKLHLHPSSGQPAVTRRVILTQS